MARTEEYTSPFTARYTSAEMSKLFSAHFKISTFRKLWVSLAKAQAKLGLNISEKQIKELEAHVDLIDFDKAAVYEKKFRHDVMAHIHAYADQCPDAKPIIHLGATSAFVTDNTDLIQLKLGLKILFGKILYVLERLSSLAEKEAYSPCLAYTHFQPAQPTTIGKRISLWLQDLLLDAQEIDRQIEFLPFLGAKGATGTQASFLTLFDGNTEKVDQLEQLIASDFGFKKILPISGQTYTRKLDLNILNCLESFAASTHKMATDIRLLSHEKELFETPTATQVGSSAMPYKKNPIYSERICGLARFVISLSQNPAYTVATQWLERTLDDSSNRRLCIPESFLAVDAILNLLAHLCSNLTIDRSIALQNLTKELPYLIQENVLMQAVKQGGDRQEIHEALRQGKNRPEPEDKKIDSLIGCAPKQVLHFLKTDLFFYLDKHRSKITTAPPIEL